MNCFSTCSSERVLFNVCFSTSASPCLLARRNAPAGVHKRQYTLQRTVTHCCTLQHATPRCNTLQHAATRCNTLQHTATHFALFTDAPHTSGKHTQMKVRIATNCIILQYTSTSSSPGTSLQASHGTLYIYIYIFIYLRVCVCLYVYIYVYIYVYMHIHTSTSTYMDCVAVYVYVYCIVCASLLTLQHAAIRCNTLQHAATRCNTLQHTATHCNTLHIVRASYCIVCAAAVFTHVAVLAVCCAATHLSCAATHLSTGHTTT